MINTGNASIYYCRQISQIIPDEIFLSHVFPQMDWSDLCTLKQVNVRLCAIVSNLYQKNIVHIIDNYLDEGTALDAVVFRARNAYIKVIYEEGATMFTISMVISEIQRELVETIRLSGVPCPKIPLHNNLDYCNLTSWNMLDAYNRSIKRAHRNVLILRDATQKRAPGNLAILQDATQKYVNYSALPTGSDQICSFMYESTDSLKKYISLDLKPQLTQIPVEINLLANLTNLCIVNQPLIDLEEGQFANLTKLKTLNLSGNGLMKVPATIFKGLSQLITLDLSDNRLKRLPRDLLHCQINLVKLNLGNNRLEELDVEQFQSQVKLTNLTLCQNKLKTLHKKTFTPLTALIFLNLDGNQLEELAEGHFEKNLSLYEINLSNNKFNKLPEDLPKLPQLEALYIDNNNLELSFQKLCMKNKVLTSATHVYGHDMCFGKKKPPQDLEHLVDSAFYAGEQLLITRRELSSNFEQIGVLHMNICAWVDRIQEKKEEFAQIENSCLIRMRELLTLLEDPSELENKLQSIEEKIVSSEKQWEEFSKCLTYLGYVGQFGARAQAYVIGERFNAFMQGWTPEQWIEYTEALTDDFEERVRLNFYTNVYERGLLMEDLYQFCVGIKK